MSKVANSTNLCNGQWVVRLRDGFRFPDTIRASSKDDRRRIIEEIWEQDATANLLQIDVYGNGDINVSVPPKVIA